MKKFSKLLCFITLLVITLVVPNVYAESNVAKVNNEECATWEDVKQKITEAESPITIQLLSTVSLDDTLVIPSGKTVTFDLNGQELQALHGKGYGIQNLGDLTITSTNQGGKLSLNTEKGSGVINSGTSLKIENITIWAGKTYAAIKNSNDDDVVRTLVVKSTEITGQFAPGIHAAGNVTIEDVKFSLSPAATLIAIPGGEEDTEVTVTNMETKSRGFVYVGDGIKGLESLDGKEGKAKLKIENVTGNTVLVGKKDSVIEGDEAMTKKAISFAEDGASIIIPEGYNEEIPNKAGVKYVNKSGKEVVYVNFEGTNYELNKGETWSNSLNEGLRKALKVARDEGKKNKVFKGFFDAKEKKVIGTTQWNENGEIHIKWGVLVTVNETQYELDQNQTLENIPTFAGFSKEGKVLHFRTVDSKEEFSSSEPITHNMNLETYYTVTITLDAVEYVLDLGKDGAATRMGNAIAANGTRLDDVMKEVPAGKYSVIYYSDGTSISASQKVDSNITLTKEVLVSVTVDGNMFTVSDGTQVQDVENLKKYLEDKKFKYFKGDDGVEYKAEDTLTHNVKLTPVYQIIVTVKDKESKGLMGVGYTATTEGITLRDILNASYGSGLKKFIDAANFVEFRDEEGNVVSLDDVITSDITLTAIYNIVLTFTDSEGNTWSVIVLEGTTLEGLKSLEHPVLSAEELKNVENKIFAGFVNAVTGEEIAEDEELTEDTTIKAVYNVRITFTDSEGNTWSVIVPEGTSLEELKSLEHAILSAEELKNVEGKIFKRFVNAVTGEEISEDQAITENISVKAIYEEEQTQEPTPVEPTPVEPPVEQETQQPPVENPSTYDGIMTSVLFAIISFISVVAGAVTFKKSFNVNE